MDRILMFHPSLGRGGVEEHTIALAEAGRQAGHHVITCSPGHPGATSVRHDLRAMGFEVLEWPLGSISNGRNDYGTYSEQAVAMENLLDTVRPDAVMVLVPWPDTCIGVLTACAAMAMPTAAIFCLVRDLPLNISPSVQHISSVARARNQRWATLSDDNRQILARLYGAKSADEIAVVHNGVDMPSHWRSPSASAVDKVRAALRDELEIPASARVVLTVSRLARGKGHQDLLDAAALLPADCDDVHFVWAGAGDLAGPLREAAETAGLGGRVHQLGHRRDIPELLHAADLFAFPSHGEGCARVLIEAMGAGLPIVCSGGSSNPEIVVDGEHGIHYPAGNPGDLAAKLTRALAEPGRMAKLAAAARERAQNVFPEREMNRKSYQLIDDARAAVRPDPDPSLITALTQAESQTATR